MIKGLRNSKFTTSQELAKSLWYIDIGRILYSAPEYPEEDLIIKNINERLNVK